MKQNKFALACILITGAAVMFVFSKRELSNGYFSTVKLQFLTNYMASNYLYDIDEEVGLEGIYTGYLDGLGDSATYYLNKDELVAEEACAKGNYFGTGLKLMWSLDEHALIVTEVITGSEADIEGIEAGDYITEVAGTAVLPANRKDIIEKITSKKKEIIPCTIERGQAVLAIDLIPGEVELEDISSEVIEHVLYVKISAVKEGTSTRLQKIIEENYEDCSGLILDLRELQTDKIEEINRIADLFLKEEISFKVQTKAEGVRTFTSDAEAFGIPMAVIVNSSTLGGAEALVLALQGRATILGSNTGGLIYIRDIISFEDGTGMSVASSIICDRYGEVLSSEGIAPDVRLYLDNEERIKKLSQGYLERNSDSYIKAAVDLFQ